MVSADRKGSITIWAWVLSIVFHTILLALLALVEFSKPADTFPPAPAPKISVNQIRQLAQKPIISPKPKIKKPASSVKNYLTLHPLVPTKDADTKASLLSGADERSISHLASMFSNSDAAAVVSAHTADLRKICYVVDCSASMFGRLTPVKQQLKTSVNNLRPDQFFYIIFFHRGRKLCELGNGKMIRATEKTKTEACSFVDTARLGGTTDALYALKRAMEIKDWDSKPPQVIFFLTDGFDLHNDTTADFPARLQQLRKQLARNTIINTIAFQPAPADGEILKTCAEQTGGQLIAIE